MRWQKLYNPIGSWLLRSPLHHLMSSSTMLITFAGRKSDKTYITTVNYVQDDRTLLGVSPRSRLWWRNLRGSAPVTVYVRGQSLQGVGRAFEGEKAVKDGGLLTVLRKVPAYRRYWGCSCMKTAKPTIHKTSCGLPRPKYQSGKGILTSCRDIWRRQIDGRESQAR